jgi:hypothetical protein
MAMAQRRLWQIELEPVSRAKLHGVPSSWRAHRISPAGVCRSRTNSIAPHDRPHRLEEAGVAVSRKWCHVPAAT